MHSTEGLHHVLHVLLVNTKQLQENQFVLIALLGIIVRRLEAHLVCNAKLAKWLV
jgi:hypothetical protein